MMPKAPLPDPKIFELGVPVLGICYGMQLLTHQLGGRVEHSHLNGNTAGWELMIKRF